MNATVEIGRVSVVADDARTEGEAHLDVDIDRWARLAGQAADSVGAAGELTLTFVDVDEIASLNADYLGVSGPTDVLSFPLDAVGAADTPSAQPVLIGDIVICPAVAARNAPNHAGTLDDELALLVVHGVLHVLGHDHAEPAEAVAMRQRERELLERWHWSGPAPREFRHTHADDTPH